MKKNVILLFLSCLVMLCLVFLQPALSDEVDTKISVSSGKPFSYDQQKQISFMATKVLRHVAYARGDIHDKDNTYENDPGYCCKECVDCYQNSQHKCNTDDKKA